MNWHAVIHSVLAMMGLTQLDNHDCIRVTAYSVRFNQLEIMHGALRNKEANQGRTFFYLREPRIKREDLEPPDDNEEEEEEEKEKGKEDATQEDGKTDDDKKDQVIIEN